MKVLVGYNSTWKAKFLAEISKVSFCVFFQRHVHPHSDIIVVLSPHRWRLCHLGCGDDEGADDDLCSTFSISFLRRLHQALIYKLLKYSACLWTFSLLFWFKETWSQTYTFGSFNVSQIFSLVLRLSLQMFSFLYSCCDVTRRHPPTDVTLQTEFGMICVLFLHFMCAGGCIRRDAGWKEVVWGSFTATGRVTWGEVISIFVALC